MTSELGASRPSARFVWTFPVRRSRIFLRPVGGTAGFFLLQRVVRLMTVLLPGEYGEQPAPFALTDAHPEGAG